MTEATGADGAVEQKEETKDSPVESKDDAGPSKDETVNLQEQAADEDAAPEETPEGDAPKEDGEPEDGESEEDADEDDEDPEDVEVEMTDINFGGNKLEVPKEQLEQFPELAKKVQDFSDNIWSDYTKGKQEVAATAASQKEQQVSLDKMTALNGEILDAYSTGRHLQDEIAQLSQTQLPSQEQMNALWQSDPDQARRTSDQIGAHRQLLIDKQAELTATINQVGQHETDLDTAQQAELERRTAEGTETLDRRIKDFSKEHAPAVVQYAIERGIPEADAKQWALNPTVTEMAHKAMMYDRMQTRTKPPKPKLAEVTPIKAPKGPGKATAGKKTASKMSDEAFAKHIGLG